MVWCSHRQSEAPIIVIVCIEFFGVVIHNKIYLVLFWWCYRHSRIPSIVLVLSQAIRGILYCFGRVYFIVKASLVLLLSQTRSIINHFLSEWSQTQIFLHKISWYFVCISSFISIIVEIDVRWKTNFQNYLCWILPLNIKMSYI